LDFLSSDKPVYGFHFFIPDEYEANLRNYSFYTNSFEGVSNNRLVQNLRDFVSHYYPEIDIDCFIKRHTTKVADFFLEELKKGKAKSNNTILGVYKVEKIKQNLKFSLFTTDYFSYNCIVSMYKELYSQNNLPFKIKDLSDIKRIVPFMCCIGIGGYINIQNRKLNYSILSKRSCSAACPNQWHFAFDETFDIRDHDSSQRVYHIPSFEECLKRGIWEELKIRLSNHDIKMRNISFVTICTEDRIECGIYLEVNIEIKTMSELSCMLVNTRFASDADNETIQLTIVPYNEIINFLHQRELEGEETTPESKFLAHYFQQLNKSLKPIRLLLSYN